MPESSDRVDADPTDGRNETATERLDRNWNEILQELRVTQTGTQILTGFLLTLAFQPRFSDLDAYQVDVYLGLVVLAALSTALGLAPVSLHRALFRKKAKREIVALADRLLQVTLLCVGLLITGVVLLIFDVVVGRTAGVVAGSITLVLLALVWLALPFWNRPRGGRPGGAADDPR
ncbi:DUF6328 family protein [Herbiconiux sp. L3-i23]|uniref:DUF6328 family protein n=1 Tax=Herbiconiux sp. L3-i23 TaxID=2905871 RepID=UPI00205483FE|nr:DUF6328 family protein [Herbiconiux sp. L3-i23]BDI22128.1 hypothetical protein L3i23_09040 [Herbiconiux sp. L3-i23]